MSEPLTEGGVRVSSPFGANDIPSRPYKDFASGKRDREDDAETKEPRKKKHTKTKTMRKDVHVNESLDMEKGINPAIGNMDSSLLADYVAQRTKRHGNDLSPVELEDRRIPGKAFLDTSDWKRPRTLDDLPKFLDHCSTRLGRKVDKLASASESPGSPHTLVLAAAALRAADLTRVLRIFQTKDAAVAKLFAKHIKLQEAIDMVKKTRIGIGVGTPSRIVDLLEAGVLRLKLLKRIVVDCSHIDEKKRGILDMRETQQPLMQLLNRSELKLRYGDAENDVQLIFY